MILDVFRCSQLYDDVGIVLCSKRKLNKNKQTKILVEMHFVVYSNFSSLDLLSSISNKYFLFVVLDLEL